MFVRAGVQIGVYTFFLLNIQNVSNLHHECDLFIALILIKIYFITCFLLSRQLFYTSSPSLVLVNLIHFSKCVMDVIALILVNTANN